MFFGIHKKLSLQIHPFSEEKDLDNILKKAAFWHEVQWGYLSHIKEDYFKDKKIFTS
ncbi:MAG TPA: hypothetical protein VHM20_05160 [Gammaproteobacteria bacterium]|jgi:hypothetical protein|nr:hypothetical protein [Gammaproteobacteria bacterium]